MLQIVEYETGYQLSLLDLKIFIAVKSWLLYIVLSYHFLDSSEIFGGLRILFYFSDS